MTPLCSLRRALSDPKLLGNALAGDSWQAWRVLLIAACGEPLSDDERVIFKRLTGREREPGERVDELAAVVGRRGGKSRALATFATYVAALCQHRLVPGERGLVLIVAQNQRAARVVLHYAEACFDAAPALAALVVSRSDSVIELKGGVALEVRWQSFRAVRGFTLCAAICDEVAFWWSDDCYANPDVETLAALRPGLLTTRGPLVLASSPYARRGVLWDYYSKHYGAAGPPATLVVQGATRDFNPMVPAAWIEQELERDPARNSSEYLVIHIDFNQKHEKNTLCLAAGADRSRAAGVSCRGWPRRHRRPPSRLRLQPATIERPRQAARRRSAPAGVRGLSEAADRGLEESVTAARGGRL